MRKYILILFVQPWLLPVETKAQLGVLPPVKTYAINLSTYINGGFVFKNPSVDSVHIFPEFTPLPCRQGGCTPAVSLALEGKRFDINHGELKWVTRNEFNSIGFEIERAFSNDTTQFSKIGFLPSQESGGFKKEYHLTDNNAFSGISYYRVKQWDADSNFLYSNIIAIKGYQLVEDLLLSPNPAHDFLYATVHSHVNTKATLHIVDSKGTLVLQQPVLLERGTVNLRLNVCGFVPGLFICTISAPGSGNLISKFIKN